MSTRIPESDVHDTEPDETPAADPPTGPTTSVDPDPERPRRRGRRRLLAGAGVLGVVAATVGALVVTDPFGGDERAAAPVDSGVTLATVRQGPLSSQVNQTGTLSYAGQVDGNPYSVVNQAGGIYTWLPNAGDVIGCGHRLYSVDGKPVVLLCGSTPAYRDLYKGRKGADVRALNSALVALGYAKKSELSPTSRKFGSATKSALKDYQDDLGLDDTGTLKLGNAVFLPGPLRIQDQKAKLATRSAPGEQVVTATSDGRQVKVDLDASQQSEVKVGDAVQILLPSNRSTTGKVTRIGTVASSSSDDQSGADSSSADANASSTSTLPVYVTLKHPKDAGNLDQAPVQVQITTAGVKRALIVPVTALIGQAGGGYAVERVDAAGIHQSVPVTLGLFDDAEGLVQVTGNLAAGDRLVVPAT